MTDSIGMCQICGVVDFHLIEGLCPICDGSSTTIHVSDNESKSDEQQNESAERIYYRFLRMETDLRGGSCKV